MNIIDMNIENLKPYSLNAKKHDDTQISNVAESIKQFGWKQPIVIDKDGVIVIGHCRYEAAKKLGLKVVPVVMADELDDEQVRKLRLLDNKTNESPWDFDLLAESLEGLNFDDFKIDWCMEYEQKDECERKDVGIDEGVSVIIECESDYEAEEIYNKLCEEGYKCHISTL